MRLKRTLKGKPLTMRWVVICRLLTFDTHVETRGAMSTSKPDSTYRPYVDVANGLESKRMNVVTTPNQGYMHIPTDVLRSEGTQLGPWYRAAWWT